MNEIFKDIPGYEGRYQVSNLGNVKSFNNRKEKILKQTILKNGYLYCGLSNKKSKTFLVHQLVAMAFLDFIPNGFNLVINHINFIKTDNRLENIEIVTQRENTNKKHLKSSSKYVGVGWAKNNKKWKAYILFKGKYKHIGYFTDELKASEAYQNALKLIKNNAIK
jgi:hypothetical protein